MAIHPTAIVEEGASIGEGVEIGPFCCVSSSSTIGDHVKLFSHVTIAGRTEIGAGVNVHPFTVLGGPPQHMGYGGEDTALVIGANTTIREHVTMNIGTDAGGGVTRVGANGFFMTGAHIGHDSTVGANVIFANNATLGGHVEIGDNVFVGGLSAVHQNSRVGDNAFIGGCSAVTTDVIPFASAVGNRAQLVGLNVIGLKRRGLPRDTIHAMRAAYRVLFGIEATFKERLERVNEQYGEIDEIRQILDFIKSDTDRSLMGPAR